MWKIILLSMLIQNIHVIATNGEIKLGDPRACIRNDKTLKTFEVLPGRGWDNLRNENSGVVVVYNYSTCSTTEDGRFLLPDGITTIPLKQSKMTIFAEFIGHWTNYTSTTSRGINIDVGLNFAAAKISGKFSSEYKNVKTKQISDESYTTRVQLRYVRYIAQLQPDTPLHPTFKNRLLDIGANIELNNTAQARYLGQLLVRDFGTHVVTSVKAGAALVQVDSLSKQGINTEKFTKSQIEASASASLFGFLNFGSSYTSATTTDLVTKYRKCRTSSDVTTNGGTLFKAVNFTANDWTETVDEDLVPVDMHGDPIFFFINVATLPNVPHSIVNEIYNIVSESVRMYYEYNTYRGCSKQESPNFSPISNLDDGTCNPALTNHTFGGVFQTCTSHPGSNNGNLCSNKIVVNPKTGNPTCPAGYETILLHTGQLSSSGSVHSCYRCWIFSTCCHDTRYNSAATYKIFWCAAKGAVPLESGYLFGGVYTNEVANPLTQSKSCPVNFHPFNLAKDLFVCICDDYELGTKYSVPFGGFISCSTGNPLAIESKPNSETMLKSGRQSLNSFLAQSGNWPKRCPPGFSQHLAYVDEGCEIMYCLKSGSLSNVGLPEIRRPPYHAAPMLPLDDKDYVKFDATKKTWQMYDSASVATSSHFADDEGMSAGKAAGISIAVILGCVAVSTILIVIVKRRSKSKGNYRRLQDPSRPHGVDYGSSENVPDSVGIDVEA